MMPSADRVLFGRARRCRRPAAQRDTTQPGARRVIAMGIAALVLAGSLAGCARPRASAARPLTPPVLYVANGLDDTISLLDANTGRPVGSPLPAGRAPWRLVTGPQGHVLVLSIGPGGGGALTVVAPVQRDWSAQPVPLDPGATVQQVAGDGGRYAAATYTLAGGDGQGGAPSCRVALIDLNDGTVVQRQSVCASSERPMSLAVTHTPAGTVLYVGLWRPAAQVGNAWVPSSGRVVALDAQTGTTTGMLPLNGLPDALFVGTGPARASRLYCVEALMDRDEDGTAYQRRAASAHGWRLWGVDPATLDVRSEQPLPYAPVGIAVAPDGGQAYAVAEPIDAQAHRGLLLLDLAAGTSTLLARVPGTAGSSLAVTEDRVYAPNPEGNEVWVADRQGRPLQTIPVGGHPLGVALSVAQ